MSTWNFKTRAELEAAGYSFKKSGVCKSCACAAFIEWWNTPNSKVIPLDSDSLKPHWATCRDSQSFKNTATPKEASALNGMHKCKVPHCSEQIGSDRLMCPPHWRLVPTGLQRQIWKHYRAGMNKFYFAAVEAALKGIGQGSR